MKNNFKKIAYLFIILLFLLVGILKVYAVTEEELKTRQQEIENQINNTNTEIAGVQENMTITLSQINRLNMQIKECEDSMFSVNEKVDKLTKELEECKTELEEAENEYNKQKAILDARLIAIYETSQTSYLDMLFDSKDITDFLSKYYMLEQIAEYDNTLLNSLDTYKMVVENKTDSVEEKKKEIDTEKSSLEAKYGAMEILIRDKNDLVSNLTQAEIDLNNQLEQFENDKKDIEKKLIDLARQNAIKASIQPSKSGYISPLLGKTKVNITTSYHGYAGHTGVDFAIPLGTEVLAVKDGTVVISTALKNANGKYRSYGEYVVIDHHDGTMTLYAHGTPNSIKVEERR